MENALKFFEEISRIPRGSGNTEGIANYLCEFAKSRGLWCEKDSFNNVIIKKRSQLSKAKAPLILQAHTDMVCEVAEGVDFDFLNNGLNLIYEDDYLKANGTTLGADDGIGLAVILSVLDSQKLSHPPIEAVFTTDEETGMDGAYNFDVSHLLGKRMINLDSEKGDTLTVSCAGGVEIKCSFPLIKSNNSTGDYYKICVDGLLGGHSGTDIDKGRANAICLLARVLYAISDFELADICSGEKLNVIPTSSFAVIKCGFDPTEIANNVLSEVLNEYKSTDSSVSIQVEKTEYVKYSYSNNFKNYLISLPNGVVSYSNEIENLVQTSLSLATVRVIDDHLNLCFYARSSMKSELEQLKIKIKEITNAFNGKTYFDGEYPGWEYDRGSRLLNDMTETFNDLYSQYPTIEAIHAGLECGVFVSKIPDLDCVSISPDVFDIHTPDEKLSLKSLDKTIKYLYEILRRMK